MSAKKINTQYLESITDDFGVWQHAHGKKLAREHGYALDDSARALIVFIQAGNLKLADVCLEYLEKSYSGGLMVGFFDEHQKIVSSPSSEDALGLAFWALGYSVHMKFEVSRAMKLYKLLDETVLLKSSYVRPHAYGLIAAVLIGDERAAAKHEEYLLKTYDKSIKWFEDTLRYANAVMPYALLVRYRMKPTRQVMEVATESLSMLHEQQRIGVFPAPVGNREWHVIGQTKLDVYGQQPIDAAFMVLAWCELFNVTHDAGCATKASYWMSWFYGHNIMQEPFAEKSDGSCMDGLDEHGLNRNCGAESTIMYLWAELTLNRALEIVA